LFQPLKHALLLGIFIALLTGGLGAQEEPSGEPQGTGLIPLTAGQLDQIITSWPRINKVDFNWLGYERISKVRAGKGRPALDQRAIRPVGREIDSAIWLPGASVQSSGANPELAGDLPVFVDNSTTPYFPPIRNQGSLGSCASFASTYYQLSYMTAFQRGLNIRDGNDNTNKYSPKWSYDMLVVGENGGSYIYQNFLLLENHGAATWAEFPYDTECRTWCLNTQTWRNALDVRTNPTQYLYYADTDSGLGQIKELLANGYILVYGTYFYSWQYKSIQDDPSSLDDDLAVGKQVGYWLNGSSGSHAMTIVGYNDAIWTDINGNGSVDMGEKGALRIANSWGTGWNAADGGFVWLAYDALRSASAVPGGPSSGRVAAFQNNMVYVLTARDDYSPLMIAEFTVNHAKRNQLRLNLGLSSLSSSAPTTVWTPWAIQNQGSTYAFDGTTTAVNGTFVFDFTDLLVEGGGPLRYHLGMNDSAPGDIATMIDYKIIDLTTEPATEVASLNGSRTVDSGQVYAYADYTYAGPAYNHPPSLVNGRVTPASGSTLETYSFFVDYEDPDGDGPAVTNIIIDEVPHSMTLSSGSAAAGRYSYQTGFSPGTHHFRFSFEDGAGRMARYPAMGTIIGPVVAIPHIVAAPNIPSGEAHPAPGSSHAYSTSGSVCDQDHDTQVRFDWGDGMVSTWLPVDQESASHVWNRGGNFNVRAQARCSSDTAVVSPWSGTLAVTVAGSSPKVDFNKDGHEDILWRYYGSGGYNRAWFLEDSGQTGAPLSSLDVPTNFNPAGIARGKGRPSNERRGVGADMRFGSRQTSIALRENTRDPMGQALRRISAGARVSDPRMAGRASRTLSPASYNDPRSVKIETGTSSLSTTDMGPASTPVLLGGVDIMPVADLDWQIVGTGDFDADGHVDILWRNVSSGTNIVWFMDGMDWAWSAEILPVRDLSWQIVGTGDFNNDARIDILWRNNASGDNIIWYMDGTSWAGSAVLLGVSDQDWQIVGTGDFNNDAHVDILWRYMGVGGYCVVWHLENATWICSTDLISVGDTNWQIVGTGDYNKDGSLDILWRYNGAGGHNVIWYMNGAAWTESAELLPVPDLVWKVVNR